MDLTKLTDQQLRDRLSNLGLLLDSLPQDDGAESCARIIFDERDAVYEEMSNQAREPYWQYFYEKRGEWRELAADVDIPNYRKRNPEVLVRQVFEGRDLMAKDT